MPYVKRTEYFKERRKKYKNFIVEVDREKLNRFEEKLKKEQTTKTDWLNRKIDEELGEK